MPRKSTQQESTKSDQEKMDVEAGLELDLAELEAMLAIDKEQVRYDQEVKGRETEVGEDCAGFSGADTSSTGVSKEKPRVGRKKRSISESETARKKQSVPENEPEKQRKRRITRSGISNGSETETALPIFSAEVEKLESDERTDAGIASTSKDFFDTTKSQDSMDSTQSINSPALSLGIGERSTGVFAVPTPPEGGKHRNPRVYSYSPISRTRLTVPKRQFSPEPARKIPKILIGPRKVTEVIRLSDLTKRLKALEVGEFSLPPDFTLKFKRRFMGETKLDTVPVNLQSDPNADVISLSLPSEDDSKKRTTAKDEIPTTTEMTMPTADHPPVVSEQIDEDSDIPKLTIEPKRRRGRKRKNIPILDANISIDSALETTTMQHVVREDPPTPIKISISKTTKGRPRKKAALIKLKRGKPRKSFAFGIADTDGASKSTVPEIAHSTISSSEISLKESDIGLKSSASHSAAHVTSVTQSLSLIDEHGNEADDEYEESKIEVLDSGMTGMYDDETRDGTQTGDIRKMNDIFNGEKDDEDGERLHIVEFGDEDDSRDIDNRPSFQAVKEKIEDVVLSVVNELLDQVCETFSPAVSLITEPLRRPTINVTESRRVPPLRIRLKPKREPRQRRPARAHDYSPPLPLSRQQRNEEMAKKRTAAISAETSSGTSAETRQKRSSRSKESQGRSSSCSVKTTTSSRLRRSSIQKSTIISDSTDISLKSPLDTTSDTNVSIVTVAAAAAASHEPQLHGTDNIMGGKNEVELPSLGPQLGSEKIALDASSSGTMQETETTGRSRRKKPVSYEELYPSLFSRRRKPASIKTSTESQQSIPGSTESKGSSTEHGDSMVSKQQQRRRGLRSSTDDGNAEDKLQQPFIKKYGLDASIYEHEDGKDPVSSSSTDGDRLYDGAGKKAIDVAEPEGTGSSLDEVRRSGRRERRGPSSSSTRDAAPHPIPETTEQGSKGQRRKTNVAIDSEAAPSEVSEPAASRSRSKRTDMKSASESTKQKEAHRSMPYFKGIAQRRKLNSLAYGLKSRSSDDNSSFFYREILLQGDDLKKEDEGDVVVDVDSEVTVEANDMESDDRSALTVALEVNKISPRPETENDDEQEDGNGTQEHLLTLDNVKTMFANEGSDRKRLLSEMMNVISAQYCSEIASENVVGGASIRYNTMVKNAYRLRNKVSLFTRDHLVNIRWAHQIFLQHLAVPMLTTYITLLRYCKPTGRDMLDIILKKSNDNKMFNKMNAVIRDYILEKIVDPQTAAIAKTLGKRQLKNICMITVAPNFIHPLYHSRARSHEYIYRVLLPNVAGRIEAVHLNLPPTPDLTVCEAVDYCIQLISRKVVEVHQKYPDLKIVLVGWGASCAINHQVVRSVSNVSAIINFAFPMKTADGPRGDVDDDILRTYCPSLFVVGDQATDCDVRELQIMAKRMIVPAGVIVIGSANCNLHPSTLRLTIERFTDRTVQRALLDDVIDFLEIYCCSSIAQSFRLHPLKPEEVNDVNLSVLRTSSLFAGNQGKPGKFDSLPKVSEKRRLTEHSPIAPSKKRRLMENVPSESMSTHPPRVPSEVIRGIHHFDPTVKPLGAAPTFTGMRDIPGTQKLTSNAPPAGIGATITFH